MDRAPQDEQPPPHGEQDDDLDPRRALVSRLFTEHNRALISFLTARLHCGQEALDVAQEAYVRMLQLDQPVSFHKAYLFRIAQNLAADRMRRRAVRERLTRDDLLDIALLQPAPEPERKALAQVELDALRHRLAELPYKTRYAFAQHVLLDRPVKEIAAQMRLTERMVRIHIVRALAHCRQPEGGPA